MTETDVIAIMAAILNAPSGYRVGAEPADAVACAIRIYEAAQCAQRQRYGLDPDPSLDREAESVT